MHAGSLIVEEKQFMLQEGDMEVLLVVYQVSEEPKGFSILVDYTFHTCCISKASVILIIHLTFQPQQKGGKLLINTICVSLHLNQTKDCRNVAENSVIKD